MLGALRRTAPAVSRLVSSSATARVLARDARPALRALRCCSPLVGARTFHHSIRWRQQAQQVEVEEPAIENAPVPGPVTEFEELERQGLVDRCITRNITGRMGLKTMTEVQTRTINEALKGADMYVALPHVPNLLF